MITHPRLPLPAFLLVSILVCTTGARDGEAPAPPPATQPADNALREQTIYIPYEKLRELFEREGRGVFLPYEEFQQLWQAARAGAARPPDAGPPLEALITGMENDAAVERDVMRVRARVQIEVLRRGWHEIPLRLGDAAILSATVDGQPARLVSADDEGYRLLLEKPGDGLERLTLELEYAKSFDKAPGRNSVLFETPRAPVSRWRIRVPQAGVKIHVEPLIAASEVPPEGAADGQTELLAFVGAAAQVQIHWTARAEGALGLQPLIAVRAAERVWVDQSAIRTRVQLAYEISRAPVAQLVLDVPAAQKVVNVFDPNVRQWAVAAAGDVQTVTVDLFEPVQGSQPLVVELERFADGDGWRGELPVPVVRASGAGRQQGLVAVLAGEGLRLEPVRRAGLLQVDAAELAAELADAGATPWTLSYRYASLPYELVLRVERIEPRITADALASVDLRPEQLRVSWQAIYDIERAGVFRLELELPAGFEVRNPRGANPGGATPVVIESHHVTEGAAPRLVVNLARKAQGRVGLAVDLLRRLEAPELRTPTGQTAELTIGVPRVADDNLAHAAGRLVLQADASLRINPTQTAGLRPIPVEEALRGFETDAQAPQPSRPAEAVAFAYAQDPVALTLEAERRKPHVTVRQLLVVRVESGVAKFEATFFYTILYSALPSLRVDVPTDLVPRLQNNTPGVREAVVVPAADPPPEGYTAWELRGETGFKDQATLKLAWETKLPPLEIGKSLELTVPWLRPVGVDRAWGQIALAKAETIDIRPTGGPGVDVPVGLRPIDPQHELQGVDDSLRAAGLARAFEFHGDWTLGVRAARYELEEVKRTSIERGVLRFVSTRGGAVAAQGVYRLRSAQQRLPVQLPQGVTFDTDPARINGRPVPLERGQNEYYVPLVGHSPETPVVLELRYTLPAGGTRLLGPDFPGEPAVQKVYLCAYLPPEWELLGVRGDWTSEQNWYWDDVAGYRPRARHDPAALLGWVTEGIDAGRPLESFQTDGQLYVYSTLHPASGAAGGLRLISLDHDWLAVGVFLVVLLIGLLLVPAGFALRVFVLGLGLAALLLGAVFLPTFVRQVLDGVFFTAGLLVLLIWAVWHVAWVRPRDPRLRALREARDAARLGRIRKPAPATSSARSAGGEQSPSGSEGQGGAPHA